MKFKRLLSSLLSASMFISMISFAVAEEESESTNYGTFNDKTTVTTYNWKVANAGTGAWSDEQNRTGETGGSYKLICADPWGASYGGIRMDWTKASNYAATNKIYEVSAWVKGVNINANVTDDQGNVTTRGTFAYIVPYQKETISYFQYAVAPYIKLGDEATTTLGTDLKEGEWVNVKGYFMSKSEDWLVDNLRIFVRNGKWVKNTTDEGADYSTIYFDDITVTEVEDTWSYFADPSFSGAKNSANSKLFTGYFAERYTTTDKTLNYAVSTLDLHQTKDVLAVGERTNLIAKLQSNGAVGNKLSDVVVTDADKQYIQVSSSNEAVVSYDSAEGVLVANGAGNAVLTVTYNDNNAVAETKYLITVYNQKYFVMDGDNVGWGYVPSPIDKNEITRVVVPQQARSSSYRLTTTTDPSKPATISFKVFYSGVTPADNNDSTRVAILPTAANSTGDTLLHHGNIFNYVRGSDTIFMNMNNTKKTNPTEYLVAGWNDIDLVISYPTTNSHDDGYMKFAFYLNGNNVLEYEPKCDFTKTDSYVSLPGGYIIDDVSIVQTLEAPAIKSIKPADGATLSTLDDIDMTFSMPVVHEAGAVTIKKGTEAVETVEVWGTDNQSLSLKPVGGLEPNTTYSVVFDSAKIKALMNSDLTYGGKTEYTFTTDSTNVQNVTGKDYILINSQYNAIADGKYNITAASPNTASQTDNELHASCEKQGSVFEIVTDDTFKATSEDTDRFIVEYYIKSDIELTAGADVPTYADRIMTYAEDESGNSGIITQIGEPDWKKNFGVQWFSLSVDETTGASAKVHNRQENVIENPYNTGYVHIKEVYDINQSGDNDVTQTVYITPAGGDTVTVEAKSSIAFVSADVKNIAKVSVHNAINKTTTVDGVTTENYLSKDLYIKDVNFYALKSSNVVEKIELTEMSIVDSVSAVIASEADIDGKNVTVSFKVKNNSADDSQEYAVMVAGYDKTTKKLLDVSEIKTGSVELGYETDSLTFNVDLTSYADSDCVLKVFVWESIRTAMPLIDAESPFNI